MVYKFHALRAISSTVIAIALVGVFALLAVAQTAYAAPYGGYKYEGATVDSGYVSTTEGIVYAVSNKVLSYDPYAEEDSAYQIETRTFITVPGMSYDKGTNTLTLKNVNMPNEDLRMYGMGTDFKIKLVGTNALCSIEADYLLKQNGKAAPTYLTFTGSGKLTVNKKKLSTYAIDLDGGGTWSYVPGKMSQEPARGGFVDGTKAKITVMKSAKLVLYGGKGGSPARISGTTIAKSSKALVIKGKARKSAKAAVKKYAAWNEYKHAEVIDFKLSKNQKKEDVYTIDGGYYVIDGVNAGDADMFPAVSLGDGIYAPNYNSSRYIVNFEGVASVWMPRKVIARNATPVYSDKEEVVVLNKGKYYAIPAKGAKKAKKTSGGNLLSWYNASMGWSDPALGWWSKWTVYKKVKSFGGKVYAKKVGTVKGVKDLPKGYKGVVLKKHKKSYTYTVKAKKLTIAPK